MEPRQLVVVGMGYVGIPAAVLFADAAGFQVTGIQRRSERSGWKIDLLNAGGSPFPENEPGIGELIRRVAVERRTFRVVEGFEPISHADVVLVDVQTPVESGDHAPRYESLKDVAAEIGRRLRRGTLVCLESTVAPGTTTNVVKPIIERASGLSAGTDFSLCFSYERVMVGRLLHNIRRYPRIVGGLTAECARRGGELYRAIVEADVITTDCLTAEVAKTVENAYRDVNIAFANEVALACESLGVDAFEVRALVNNLPNDPSKPSSNPVRNMHVPGAGVGGHCLPKDSWLLKFGVDSYGRSPVDLRVILGSRAVNDRMPIHAVDLVCAALDEAGVPHAQAKVAVLGYAFLEDSDDTRNTPARAVIDELLRRGIRTIAIHDSFVRKEELPGVERDPYRALEGADCACIVTGHSEYRTLDPYRIRTGMRHPLIVDGRNTLAGWTPGEGVKVITLGSGRIRAGRR